MIKIIENALKDLAGMQLNIESDVARTWIAQKVATAITEQQDINEVLTKIVPEQNIDDVITTAMKNNGYTKGDSGYDMRTGKRDITFHTEDGQQFEVTFRRIWPDD
jgi:copper chaperone CopZ